MTLNFETIWTIMYILEETAFKYVQYTGQPTNELGSKKPPSPLLDGMAEDFNIVHRALIPSERFEHTVH